jgi:hypothetical protein
VNRPAAAGESAALSRELADFLIEFSIGIHKNAIYPPGHPLLESATAGIVRRLEALLKERSTLSLGVARHQLIIEGVATDENNPVLRDLAQRLHRHQLGAVRIIAGVDLVELADVLATVAVDAGRRERPLGLEPPEVLDQWPHVRLLPMTFEQLQLLDEDPAVGEERAELRGHKSRAAQLWIGLARASLAADAVDSEDDAAADPVVVAKAIDSHDKDVAYDQVVVGYLLQIAEELKQKGGKEAAALQKRISRLVSTLQPETLQRLMQMGGDDKQRRRFVLDAAQGMAVDAVVDLVQAAADTSGQTISHSLVRLLSKLAVHADQGPTTFARTSADGELRDQVQRLMSDWELEDPNPDAYRQALERMAQAAPMFTGVDRFPCEPERLVAMGLEIEVLGDPVWRSVEELLARTDPTPLFDLLDRAPAGWMPDTLWHTVGSPDTLAQLLRRTPVPMALVTRLVAKMRLAAVDPLLDAIETADDRTAAQLTDLLAGLGAEVGGLIASRLPSARWVHQRVFLQVIGKLAESPPGFSPAAYTRHPDPAVRREAFRMQMRSPATRDDAIAQALSDSDERMVRLALGAAMQACPPAAASILMVRAADETLSPDLRALGIRAVASYKSAETVGWLVERCLGKKRFFSFGRRSLATKTPEMLAALAGLAAHWRTDPAAVPVLQQAARSSDPEIAEAAGRRGGAPA